jgi:rod shape determining protein RodA
MWILVGVLGCIIVAAIDYTRLRRFSWHIYGLSLLLLLGVLAYGSVIHGTQGWFQFGSFQFQPAEFVKVTMIICFADFLVQRQGKLSNLRELLPAFLYMGLPVLLIIAQPDLGTSLVFIAIMLGMLYVGGANAKLLGGITFGGISAVIAWIWAHFRFGVYIPLADYQLRRFIVFINPYNDGMGGRGDGYQIIQSKVAIGSGGLFGKGLGEGSQIQLNFLPEHHTDFIFSVVGEELGFIGGALLLILYFILLFRMNNIALKAKDNYGTLLVAGVASMLAFHILVNVGMTMGIMPITGIPLPFVSYGGSSMLSSMLALGLVISVNLRRQQIPF